jgi:Protein of unknown function (DUF2281)
METIEEMIKELPLELQREVYDFTRFLLVKKIHPIHKKLQMTWAGGLRDFREQYTSV